VTVCYSCSKSSSTRPLEEQEGPPLPIFFPSRLRQCLSTQLWLSWSPPCRLVDPSMPLPLESWCALILYFSASEEQVRPPARGATSQLGSSQSPLTSQLPSLWDSMQGGAAWAREPQSRGLVRDLCGRGCLLQPLPPSTMATSLTQCFLSSRL